MKKLLIAIAMMGATTFCQAQEVFNIVLKKAEDALCNPKASEFELKVNQFKVTALRYVPTKGIKLNGEVSTELMDLQAYNLNVFLTEYFKALKAVPEADRMNCIMHFVHATQKHPLYKDDDKEATEAFVNDPGGYTPFSINVKWEDALEEVMKK